MESRDLNRYLHTCVHWDTIHNSQKEEATSMSILMDEEIQCGIYVKWITIVLSVAKSCPTLCDPMDCSTSGFLVHHQLPELVQTHVHWVGNAIQPSHPLTPSSPSASIFPSIRDLSKESAVLIRWGKYWSFNLSISPYNEYSGLISLKIDWFDLLAVQGTLRNLLQHHSPKPLLLWCYSFFTIQLSQPCAKLVRWASLRF